MILDVRMPEHRRRRGLPAASRRSRSRPSCRSSWSPPTTSAARGRGARGTAPTTCCIAPIHRAELVARVRSLLRLRLFHDDLVRHENVVLSLSAALEAKDAYTRGHSQRVGELSSRARARARRGRRDRRPAADSAGCSTTSARSRSRRSSSTSRVGSTTARVRARSWSTRSIGWEICRRLRSAAPVLDVIRYHHERFDGGGYPEGLAGEAIPWHARILGGRRRARRADLRARLPPQPLGRRGGRAPRPGDRGRQVGPGDLRRPHPPGPTRPGRPAPAGALRRRRS